ncbi:MAG: bifunctional (p)ppGpp synthetase/guanosine-3',5'-bis(diphosphate) 3'-pyrophosphohydrolase [Deltaproteobacteria bacterium]|nr:bifunctional (p)ppGpp synthetase/guanosine-3',5'-bis(diphosphate) 3'-pyrophosphohydrolase [Deltaproteobacteria bacterium]
MNFFSPTARANALKPEIKKLVWEPWKQWWEDESIRERHINSIVRSCSNLLNFIWRHWGNQEDVFNDIEKALLFAIKAHARQSPRKTGEPYVSHPISVATNCAEHGIDREGIISALLHDVIEDTEYSEEEIIRTFGTDVGEIVNGLSKVKSHDKHLMDKDKVQTFFKIMGASGQDNLIRTVLIKLLDRLDNMKTVEVFRVEKRQRYARETIYIYSSLATILGMREIATELTTKSMKPFFTNDYARVAAKSTERQNRYIADRNEIQDLLKNIIGERVNVKFHPLYPTMADFLDPLTKSLKFDGIPLKLRVRVPTIPDMYVVLGMIHGANAIQDSPQNSGHLHVIPDSWKDYVVSPLANGYKALTTQIFFKNHPWLLEIVSMETEGTIDWGILSDFKNPELRKFYFKSLNAFLNNIIDIENMRYSDLQNEAANAISDIQVRCRNNLFMRIPVGSTVLDVAYILDGDLGLYCKGANLNGREVDRLHKLRHGDNVEIITQTEPVISEKFLTVMKSRNAIDNYRKTVRLYYIGKAYELGKGVCLRFLEVNQMNELDIFDESGEPSILSIDEIIDIGLGKITASEVFESHGIYIPYQGLFKKVVKKLPRKIDSFHDLMYQYPDCCNIVPLVDENAVMQHMKSTDDLNHLGLIQVHSSSCPVLTEDLPQIPVEWDLEFPPRVILEVYVNDTIGLVGKITSLIGKYHLNITALKADSTPVKNDWVKIFITLHLREGEQAEIDHKRFTTCIRTLKKIKEVRSISLARE